MAKVLIIYSSQTGNTEKMSEMVEKGLKSAGVDVVRKKTGDTDASELLDYDGIVIGTPCYYGLMSADIKKILDESVGFHGKLEGKVGAAFCSSANVGGGNKGCTTNQLFYPGPNGAVPTLRYQLIRENILECEARIFLEKLLVAKPCPLPPALAAKCQEILDERTRWHRVGFNQATGDVNISWAYSGWAERAGKLFAAAGEAARAVAKK